MTFTTRVCPFSCKIAQKKTFPLPLYSCNPFKSLRNSSKVYESTKLSGFALSLFSFAQTSLLAGYVVFAIEGSRQSAETCSNGKICQSCERFNFEINNTRCMLHANLSTDSNGPICSSILSQRVERQGHSAHMAMTVSRAKAAQKKCERHRLLQHLLYSQKLCSQHTSDIL